MTGAESLTISEVAQTYRISLRTLRFYEERGLLAPRRVGQSRFYSAEDQIRLRVILQARRLGFTLTEVARLIESRQASPDRGAEMTSVLSRSQIETQIAVLTQRRDMAAAAIDELRAALRKARLVGGAEGAT